MQQKLRVTGPSALGEYMKADADDVAKRKNVLRADMRRLEAALSQGYRRAADRMICAALLERAEYSGASVIFTFVGVGMEIDTRPFIKAALSAGKTVAVPLCTGRGSMEARAIASLEDLRPGSFGIPEPGPAAPLVEAQHIDLAVVPCLSCTEEGVRLGRGGGYYDRYLAAARIPAIMVCRQAMMLKSIPSECHDILIDVVIHDNNLL